jgi:hypothetical protein
LRLSNSSFDGDRFVSRDGLDLLDARLSSPGKENFCHPIQISFASLLSFRPLSDLLETSKSSYPLAKAAFTARGDLAARSYQV